VGAAGEIYRLGGSAAGRSHLAEDEWGRWFDFQLSIPSAGLLACRGAGGQAATGKLLDVEQIGRFVVLRAYRVRVWTGGSRSSTASYAGSERRCNSLPQFRPRATLLFYSTTAGLSLLLFLPVPSSFPREVSGACAFETSPNPQSACACEPSFEANAPQPLASAGVTVESSGGGRASLARLGGRLGVPLVSGPFGSGYVVSPGFVVNDRLAGVRTPVTLIKPRGCWTTTRGLRGSFAEQLSNFGLGCSAGRHSGPSGAAPPLRAGHHFSFFTLFLLSPFYHLPTIL